MVSICDKCDRDLSTNSKLAIHCDAGDHWFCYSCIGMSDKLFKAISAEKETPMLFVSCKDCRASSFPMAALKKSTAIEFNDINSKIKDLSAKFDSFNKDIEGKVDESLKMIKEQAKVTKVNYADMVKKSIESREEISSVKEAVKVSVRDLTEYEERDKSIVIFKLNESKKDSAVKRNQEDREFVEALIDQGINISPQEIQTSFRLGLYKDNVTRPVKVIFANKSSQVKVVEHLYRLREAEQRFKDVNISIDRTRAQRDQLKVLIDQADQQTRASNDKKYVVRGTYKPYIVERTK